MHHFEIVTLWDCSNTSNQREINTPSDSVHTGLFILRLTRQISHQASTLQRSIWKKAGWSEGVVEAEKIFLSFLESFTSQSDFLCRDSSVNVVFRRCSHVIVIYMALTCPPSGQQTGCKRKMRATSIWWVVASVCRKLCSKLRPKQVFGAAPCLQPILPSNCEQPLATICQLGMGQTVTDCSVSLHIWSE